MADGVATGNASQISTFLEWCTVNGMKLSSKVRIGKDGSCHRYGMVAVEDIAEGECLFEIPRTLTLWPQTSFVASILAKLEKEEALDSERSSGWVPLLLALMYEFSNSESFWKPYLDLTPDVTTLDQPLFWSAEERQVQLTGTGIEEDVENDVQHLEEEYRTIVVPFMRKNSKYFNATTHTLALYKHMAAFVMAYSFTDEDPNVEGGRVTLMVPMADILNHVSDNNAQLEFGPESLKMLATCDISKGSEVYNTYGKLGNCHLLQSYGFIEEYPNPHDMVEIPLSAFYQVLKAQSSSRSLQLLDAKFSFMEEMGVTAMDDVLLFGVKGCSEFGSSLYAILKILHLDEMQFKHLLKEQTNQQFSEEFEDISHLLNPEDEDENEVRVRASLRLLEKVFSVETKVKRRGLLSDVDKATKRRKKDTDQSASSCKKSSDNYQKDFYVTGRDASTIEENEIKSAAAVSSELVDMDGNAKHSQHNGASSIDQQRCNEEDVSRQSDSEYLSENEEGSIPSDGDSEEEESDDDEDEDEQSLSYSAISEFPNEWKRTLSGVCAFCIQQRYGSSVDLDTDVRKKESVGRRHWLASQIKRGQKALFRKIIDAMDAH